MLLFTAAVALFHATCLKCNTNSIQTVLHTHSTQPYTVQGNVTKGHHRHSCILVSRTFNHSISTAHDNKFVFDITLSSQRLDQQHQFISNTKIKSKINQTLTYESFTILALHQIRVTKSKWCNVCRASSGHGGEKKFTCSITQFKWTRPVKKN